MLRPSYLTDENLNTFIQRALIEDIGEGDHSTLASVPPQAYRKAQLIIKGEGILAGVELAAFIFKAVDPELQLDLRKKDGEKVSHGEIGFFVEGKARSILTSERLVLNCLQRMSGIATLTRRAVDEIAHTNAKLLDTRKTTPNFRMAEKWAVFIGGGHNHRYGLFDMIMLKDNHIAYAGGIRDAIESTLRYQKNRSSSLRVEIETQNLMELKEVLEIGQIDFIMLDNMSVEDMSWAVRLVKGRYPLEASGGITLENIKAVAETGVDYISMGALTHSAPSMDISLKAVNEG